MRIVRRQRWRHKVIEAVIMIYFTTYCTFANLHTGARPTGKRNTRGRRIPAQFSRSYAHVQTRNRSRHLTRGAALPDVSMAHAAKRATQELPVEVAPPPPQAGSAAAEAPSRPKSAVALATPATDHHSVGAPTKRDQIDRGPMAAETAAETTAQEKVAGPASGGARIRRHEPDSIARRIVISQMYARPAKTWWQRFGRLATTLAVAATLIMSARAAAAYVGANNTFSVRIDNQQPVTIDPRASAPRSPVFFGTNVFPEEATQALDGAYGFMPYDANTIDGLNGAGVTTLRFPGGTWGEEHTYSLTQLAAFLTLAQKTHATPLIQARLRGSSPAEAAALVSYCNRADDRNRESTPNVPFLPVRYWVIGNEPDLVGSGYTVSDYVRDFIAYATAMKAVDPTIQIYGPELSQVDGANVPRDSAGTPWLTGFLQGISSYEKAHQTRLLDGISFHAYVFGSAGVTQGLLMSSANAWRYILPQIRLEVQDIMGENLPIAVTEINTNIHGTADVLAAALWWADTLGALQEEQVNIVDFFAARGLAQQDMLLTQSGKPTPLYYVMRLYKHMAQNVVQVGAGPGPVSVYAATSPSHETITLMFVNKSPYVSAVSITPGQMFNNWRSVRLNVPPFTSVCVVLHHDRPGQLFIYGPTSSMLAHGDMGRIVSQPLP
jgi:glycosyl hydrolase family 44